MHRLWSLLYCFDNIWCYLGFLPQLIIISSVATLSRALVRSEGGECDGEAGLMKYLDFYLRYELDYISKLKKVLFLGKSWVMPGNEFDTYVKSNSCGFFNLWKDSGCLSYLGCYRLPCLTKGNRMSSKLHLFLRIFFQFISTAVLEPVSAILLCTENFISDRWLNR